MNTRALSRLMLILFFGIACTATVASWRWYGNNPSVSAANCTLVAGRLYAARQWSYDEHRNLDVYLRGNPLCFRVPTDSNGADFSGAAFVKANPPGSRVAFWVRQSELDHPFRAPFSSNSLVWVSGLRDARSVYYSVAQARAWDVNNRRLGFDMAIVFTLITLGLAVGYFASKLRGVDLMAPAPPRYRTPEQLLAIGKLQLRIGPSVIGGAFIVHRLFFASHPMHELFIALCYPIATTIFGAFNMLIARRQIKRQNGSAS